MKTFFSLHRGTVLTLAAFALVPALLQAKDRGVRPMMIAKFADSSPMAVDALANTPDAWTNIKDYSYAQRADFVAVFAKMVAKFDDDIRALNAKRATMTNDTKEWDFAMKELNNARADVQSKTTDLSKATPETWVEARDRLGAAWDRARNAYRAVTASTTS
jgi:hypothetical protein